MSKKPQKKNKKKKLTTANEVDPSLSINQAPLKEANLTIESSKSTTKMNDIIEPNPSPKTISKNPKTNESKKPLVLGENFTNKIIAVVLGIVFIGLTITLVTRWVPDVSKQTDEYLKRVEREKLESKIASRKERLEQSQKTEAEAVSTLENRSVKITTNFGDITADLRLQSAPESVENFARLTHRGFYIDQKIHRAVKTTDFNVIQGGRAEEDQSATAFNGSTIQDELWIEEPIFDQDDLGNSLLKNTPKLREPALAQNFDPNTGTILYPKGLIVMAKTPQPDSATTQFFIILKDTILPAQYTPFAQIRESDFGVLDRIFDTLEIIPADPSRPEDGTPKDDITYSIELL